MANNIDMRNLINDIKSFKDVGISNKEDTTDQNSKFSKILSETINKVEFQNIKNEKMQENFILGQENVSISEVMGNMQKSEIYTNLLIESRNKIVNAYHEIMNMNI